MKRVGIFGGTFDPVHIAHLRCAIELADSLALDHVNLLPCHLPPHRDTPGATTSERIEMLELAVESVPQLKVDAREALRDTPSYTVETLESYRKEQPDAQLLFFMGMDAFNTFTRWHRWEAIFDLAHLVVVERPGSHLAGPEADLLKSRQITDPGGLNALSGHILVQSVTQFDISATRIRELVSQNRDISYLVTAKVRRYIKENGLYSASIG